jgi:hypothetical protein
LPTQSLSKGGIDGQTDSSEGRNDVGRRYTETRNCLHNFQNMVTSPTRFGTKNGCDDEDHQQFKQPRNSGTCARILSIAGQLYRTLLQKLWPNNNAAYCLTEVNLKLSLCFIKHQFMKTYGGVDVYLHTFLTLALDKSEW